MSYVLITVQAPNVQNLWDNAQAVPPVNQVPTPIVPENPVPLPQSIVVPLNATSVTVLNRGTLSANIETVKSTVALAAGASAVFSVKGNSTITVQGLNLLVDFVFLLKDV